MALSSVDSFSTLLTIVLQSQEGDSMPEFTPEPLKSFLRFPCHLLNGVLSRQDSNLCKTAHLHNYTALCFPPTPLCSLDEVGFIIPIFWKGKVQVLLQEPWLLRMERNWSEHFLILKPVSPSQHTSSLCALFLGVICFIVTFVLQRKERKMGLIIPIPRVSQHLCLWLSPD